MNKGAKKTLVLTPTVKKEIVKIIDQRIKDVHVTKEDFSELKGLVTDIAVAQKELTEAQKRTEVRVEELAHAQKRTESRVEDLTEAQSRTEARVEELAVAMKEGFRHIDSRITALGGRWGIMAESTFREAVKGILEKTGHTVSKGYYGNREVDVVVRNGEHMLVEITSSMKKSDIGKYINSADDYRDRTGINPTIMVAAIYIPPTVMRELADAPRKIEIFSMEE